VYFRPDPHRQGSLRPIQLKGKKKKKSAKDRFIPIPAKLVWKIKDRMRERDAQPHDLVFPNGNGKPDGHFLRKLKAVGKKAGSRAPSFIASERRMPTPYMRKVCR
jgi:hypothetical protein